MAATRRPKAAGDKVFSESDQVPSVGAFAAFVLVQNLEQCQSAHILFVGKLIYRSELMQASREPKQGPWVYERGGLELREKRKSARIL